MVYLKYKGLWKAFLWYWSVSHSTTLSLAYLVGDVNRRDYWNLAVLLDAYKTSFYRLQRVCYVYSSPVPQWTLTIHTSVEVLSAFQTLQHLRLD
jgi:hypothetical protein